MDSVSSEDSLADLVEDFPTTEQCCLALSKSAVSGVPVARTVCLQGMLQSIPVKILVDSGSSSSFVNESLVAQLTDVESVPLSSSVQVAGGAKLVSTTMLRQVPWSVGDCSFQTDFRVLPLGNFDVVIGMDWLASYSPMQIHWNDKWIAIPYKGGVTILQGLNSSSPHHLLIQVDSIAKQDAADSDGPPLPIEMQSLLDAYSDLFQPPTSLPPSRACDHEIPLIPGATPVFVRPYRYPPKLKDEIEKQVQDMLSQLSRPHSP